MTPDAGSSDKVNKNHGFLAIPEVGDQVIINFVHQHPDRPFVMGGMFHGVGIEIKDRKGNHVTLSGTGDVTTFVSNDNNEDIGNNHTTNVATKTTINVGKDQSVLTMDNGGKISVKSNTEIKLETGSSSITMKKDGTIDIKGIRVVHYIKRLLMLQKNCKLY